MFRFEHTAYLYGLLLIPVFALLFWMLMRWKRKSLNAFGEHEVVKRLLLHVSYTRVRFKFILLMIAFGFLVIALANPQIGSRLEKAERKGIDIMIALDVSNSMLAQDIKPNRLERARQTISRLVDKLGNDRIGIVVFAGKAYKQLPITTDFAAAKLFLATINTSLIPTQGTAIGEAIELAMTSFDSDKHTRAIVVITDGENHEDNAVEAAEKSSQAGIRVFIIGMGLGDGAPIPEYNEDGIPVGFKKDRDGSTVVTRLNETMCQQIASAGNGTYVSAVNTDAGIRKILDDLGKLEKKEFESKVFSDYEDRFQYFLAVCIILLVVDALLTERKSKWISRINLFGNRI